MKITNIEVLHCKAGWRKWSFVKISTNESIVGYAECSESFGSIQGVEGCVKDLSKLLIGEDPRAIESLYWKMYRATRQSVGGIAHKAIGAIENALLDIKAKALNIPVYELLGGPTREEIRVYWSHCGSTRVRSAEHIDAKPINSADDIADLGKEVMKKGFTALKTNIILFEPTRVIMQGFKGGYGTTDQNISNEILDGLDLLIGSFREAVGNKVDLCLDLNFHFKTEGNLQIARRLEKYNLMWLELDNYDPLALAQVKNNCKIPICSGEDLYTARGYRPYFENHSMDVASLDVIWNGVLRSKKIADMAELYEMNVAPHNHYSHLATLISAHFCASIPNVRILETDIDDVSWKDELVTKAPIIEKGNLKLPKTPGWGADLDEEVLKQHNV